MKKTTTLAAALLMLATFVHAGETIEKSFDVSPGETLAVDLDTGGSVTVKGTGGNKVHVRATLNGRDADEIELQIQRSSKGVQVEAEYNSMWGNHSGGVDIEVEVPSRFNLDLETLGGSLVISDIEGNLEGSTMGGTLDLRNLKGTVEMSTMGGKVILEDSTVDGEVSTMGGNVTLRNVIGNVKGKSMGGNVIYDNVAPPAGASAKPVEISTMGGDVEVPNAPAGAKVSTMGGDIQVESAGTFVKAKTMGGDIDIREIDGWVEATTMGGDIEVKVVGTGGDRHIELESKGGNVHLTLPAEFSGSFDIEINYSKRGRDESEIRSDFPLQIKNQVSEKGWSHNLGTITGTGSSNGGQNKVVIRTIDGEVVIKKK